MIYKKLDVFDFRQEFIEANLDEYSSEGYIKLFEWLESMVAEGRFIDEVFELDVEHITDTFMEVSRFDLGMIYGHLIPRTADRTVDNVIAEVENNTTIIWLDDEKSRGIVQEF